MKFVTLVLSFGFVFLVGVFAERNCPAVQKFFGCPVASKCCEKCDKCRCLCNCGCCKTGKCDCGDDCPCDCGCGQTGKCDCCPKKCRGHSQIRINTDNSYVAAFPVVNQIRQGHLQRKMDRLQRRLGRVQQRA